MAKISATRAELAARKERLELAQVGQSLLEEKRAALVKELMPVVDRLLSSAEELSAAARRSQQALVRANAQAGAAQVRSAALAAQDELLLDFEVRNVMGVRVPVFEPRAVRRNPQDRGYAALDTSLSIDGAAASFEEEVEIILRLAESELRLRRLSGEIRELTRRVNSLEQIVIPRIGGEIDYIEMKLAEQERDRKFRLRLVKRRLRGRR